ncbi:hypothetical protein ACVWY5_001493 [Bradyrhizobium sp. USDA 3256]
MSDKLRSDVPADTDTASIAPAKASEIVGDDAALIGG